MRGEDGWDLQRSVDVLKKVEEWRKQQQGEVVVGGGGMEMGWWDDFVSHQTHHK